MNEPDRSPKERSRAYVLMLGLGALFAWFGLLYFMFGEVL